MAFRRQSKYRNNSGRRNYIIAGLTVSGSVFVIAKLVHLVITFDEISKMKDPPEFKNENTFIILNRPDGSKDTMMLSKYNDSVSRQQNQ